MYAVIATGGKQYTVKVGDVVSVEKLGLEAGEKVAFEEVLFISNDGQVKVGNPTIDGAKVSGEVVENGKNKKVIAFKFKAKKGYHKKKGHRQPFTKVKIESIEG